MASMFSLLISFSTAVCYPQTTGWYYNQLNELQKPYYEALQVWCKEGNLPNGNNTMFLTSDTRLTNKVKQSVVQAYSTGSNSEMLEHFRLGMKAFELEHPEVFYVDYSKISFKVSKTTTNLYTVLFGSVTTPSYLINNLTDVDDLIETFNTSVNNYISNVNSNIELNNKIGDTYNRIGAVDTNVINYLDSQYGLWINSAFGAIVYNKATAIGIAKAYSLYLTLLKVPNVLCEGTAKIDGNLKAHSWIVLQINNKLYLSDPVIKIMFGTSSDFEEKNYGGSVDFDLPVTTLTFNDFKYFEMPNMIGITYHDYTSSEMEAHNLLLVYRVFTTSSAGQWMPVQYLPSSNVYYVLLLNLDFMALQFGILPKSKTTSYEDRATSNQDVYRRSPLIWSTTATSKVHNFNIDVANVYPMYSIDRASNTYLLDYNYTFCFQLSEKYQLVDSKSPIQINVSRTVNGETKYELINTTGDGVINIRFNFKSFQEDSQESQVIYSFDIANVVGLYNARKFTGRKLTFCQNQAYFGSSFVSSSAVLPVSDFPALLVDNNANVTRCKLNGKNFNAYNPNDIKLVTNIDGSKYDISLQFVGQSAELSEGQKVTVQVPFPADYNASSPKKYIVKHTVNGVNETIVPANLPTGLLISVSSFSPFYVEEASKPEEVSLYVKTDNGEVHVYRQNSDEDIVNKVLSLPSNTDLSFDIKISDNSTAINKVFFNGEIIQVKNDQIQVVLKNASNVIEIFTSTKKIVAMEQALNLTSVFVTSNLISNALAAKTPISNLDADEPVWPPIFQEYSNGSKSPVFVTNPPSKSDSTSPPAVITPIVDNPTEPASSDSDPSKKMSKPAYVALLFCSVLAFCFVVIAIFFIGKTRSDIKRMDKNILGLDSSEDDDNNTTSSYIDEKETPL
ncbi:hypothetical protein TVAG_403680 [Trichomonas vaginalis G3]|uniref:Transglutaminase-like domain-containing protein n=1 Tax=Trichomonas vaginalis (strain ATCC PRA-98 / G3) TaxID=412133 RepID=A2ELP6_TRIV3|nr:immunoglobulin family [Trichomonas vaginalis G3]EAY06411.1 hypothetical protein TVAG_403680 [Trichomonas vaginalis G3]KAI5502999.1 immunoglobulin family [Trichomonas vaginalis G3]|eukprot:XP_001318634.1 hypothetical protein [Trichomonas vaginalis G3]